MNTLTSLRRLSRFIQPSIGKTLNRSHSNQSLPLGPPFSDNLTSPTSDHPFKYISNYGYLENLKSSPSLSETVGRVNVEHTWQSLGSLGTKFDVMKVVGSLSIPYAANFRCFIHSTRQKYLDNEPPSRPMNFDNERPSGPMNFENERPSRPAYFDNERPSRPMNFDNEHPSRPMNFNNERPSGPMNFNNERPSRPAYFNNERPSRPAYFNNERPSRPMNFDNERPSTPMNFENERSSRPAYFDNERPSRPMNFDNEQPSRSMNFVRGIIEKERTDFFENTQRVNPEVNADIVHIKILKNNTFITVTDSKGNKKIGASSGCLSGGGKVSRYAAEATAEHIGRVARNMGLKSVVMKVNGFTFFKKKRQAMMSFREGYTYSRGDQNPIVYIEDTTRRPHNGCRLPKKRRV